MSATINTSVGNQPVDPYRSKSVEDPPLPKKVEDLSKLISDIKLGMLTTKSSSGDDLVSRCMALADKVYTISKNDEAPISSLTDDTRKTAASTSFSTQTSSPEKRWT